MNVKCPGSQEIKRFQEVGVVRVSNATKYRKMDTEKKPVRVRTTFSSELPQVLSEKAVFSLFKDNKRIQLSLQFKFSKFP